MLLVKLIEPPCTERYARWCERSEFLIYEKFLLLDWIENETKVFKVTCLNRDKENPKGRFLYKCHNNMKLCPYYFFLNNTGEVTIIGFDRARTEDPKTASA